MTLEVIRKIIGGILLVSLVIIGFSKPAGQYFNIPLSVTIFEGQQLTFAKAKPVSASLFADNSSITLSDNNHSVSLQGVHQGKNELILEYAGFPMKKVDVNVLKDFKVVPGGQSIGVKLNTVGVLVV